MAGGSTSLVPGELIALEIKKKKKKKIENQFCVYMLCCLNLESWKGKVDVQSRDNQGDHLNKNAENVRAYDLMPQMGQMNYWINLFWWNTGTCVL